MRILSFFCPEAISSQNDEDFSCNAFSIDDTIISCRAATVIHAKFI